MPSCFGMGKSIANMRLYKLSAPVDRSKGVPKLTPSLSFLHRAKPQESELETSFAAINTIGLQYLVSTKLIRGKRRSAFTTSGCQSGGRRPAVICKSQRRQAGSGMAAAPAGPGWSTAVGGLRRRQSMVVSDRLLLRSAAAAS